MTLPRNRRERLSGSRVEVVIKSKDYLNSNGLTNYIKIVIKSETEDDKEDDKEDGIGLKTCTVFF